MKDTLITIWCYVMIGLIILWFAILPSIFLAAGHVVFAFTWMIVSLIALTIACCKYYEKQRENR